jgi:hypothetical protein
MRIPPEQELDAEDQLVDDNTQNARQHPDQRDHQEEDAILAGGQPELLRQQDLGLAPPPAGEPLPGTQTAQPLLQVLARHRFGKLYQPSRDNSGVARPLPDEPG